MGQLSYFAGSRHDTASQQEAGSRPRGRRVTEAACDPATGARKKPLKEYSGGTLGCKQSISEQRITESDDGIELLTVISMGFLQPGIHFYTDGSCTGNPPCFKC